MMENWEHMIDRSFSLILVPLRFLFSPVFSLTS